MSAGHDHLAQANEAVEAALKEASTALGPASREFWLAKAQAQATMALAFQQARIADWLEAWPIANDEAPIVHVNGVS